MEKTIAVTSHLDWTPEQVKAIKDTVAKGATDSELQMLFHVSKTYGLDPFLKEIQLIKGNNGITLYTTRDGYLKIAHRENEEFDGMRSDVLREGDVFKTSGLEVQHEYGQKRGRILGAWCLVYRKSKRVPFYFFAPFDEYYKNADNWKKYPSAMIQKVSEAMCLKRAFSITGMVTKEEMEVGDAVDAELVGDIEKSTTSTTIQERKEDYVPVPKPAEEVQDEDAGEPLSEQVKEEIDKALKNQERQAVKAKQRDPKIVLWERYLGYFGTPENAKASIERLVGSKPSARWTEEDIHKLQNEIDKLGASQGNLFDIQEEPKVKEPKPEDEFMGIGPDEPAKETQLEKSKQKMAREETELLREKLIDLAREHVGLTEKEFIEWLKNNYVVYAVSQLTKDRVKDAIKKMNKVLENRDKQKRLPEETGGLA